MPIPLLVLVFLAFIPYLLAGLGGYVKIKQLGYLDNHHPRIQATKLVGFGARVVAAQSNAWEALALYTASLFVATQSGVEWAQLTTPTLLFALTRVAHPILYLGDIPKARSLVVVLGVGCCGYMVSQGL